MSICTRCGATFSCAMAETDVAQPCWCSALPPLSLTVLHSLQGGQPKARCLCPVCLRQLTDAGTSGPACTGN